MPWEIVGELGSNSIIAVGIGAALGAWLRWWLGATLNPIFPTLPFGTLAANLLGGYFIGVALEYFSHKAVLPPEARSFIITGFLGGLTTFSTFSAETVLLLLREQYGWAFTIIFSHLAGSLLMTVLGILTINGWPNIRASISSEEPTMWRIPARVAASYLRSSSLDLIRATKD